uniref:Uncharacterized protein n=1 Tax=Arundo donax TaxID=35708 RepID=A0A0A9EWT0_ARUDO
MALSDMINLRQRIVMFFGRSFLKPLFSSSSMSIHKTTRPWHSTMTIR